MTLKFLGFLLLNLFVYSAADPVGTCPLQNGAFVDFLTDSSDCTVFYKCNWGTPIEFVCPDDLHFNPVLNVCDWPWAAGCGSATTTTPEITTTSVTTTTPTTTPTPTTTTTTPTPTTTTTADPTTTPVAVAGCLGATCPFFPAPPATVTFFPHDSDCGRYCMCDWFSTVHDMPCPDGLHWNSVLDTCDWPWAAGCGSATTATPEITTTSVTTTTPTTTPTPTTTTTTPTPTTTTTTPTPTTTTTADPTTTPVALAGCLGAACPFFPAPPATVTFFPHDSDCGRYCMCDWYSTVHDMPCPDGLHWNSALDTCDWPSAAGCGSATTTG